MIKVMNYFTSGRNSSTDDNMLKSSCWPEVFTHSKSKYFTENDTPLDNVMFSSYMPQSQSDIITEWREVGDKTWIPVLAISLYLLMVFIGPTLMKKRPAFKLKTFSILWNLGLSLFSIQGAIVTLPRLFHFIHQNGFQSSVCSPALICCDRIGFFWSAIFIYSKLLELVDTALLILKKKPVIFLHWFHHTTVLIMTWLCQVYVYPAAYYFCAMNYGVHAVMYTYYFATQLGLYKYVRPVAPFITILQLLQMIIGASVVVASFLFDVFTEIGCNQGVPSPTYESDGVVDSGNYYFFFRYLFYGFK